MKKLALGSLPALALLLPMTAFAAPTDRVAHGNVVVAEGEQVADAVAFGGDLTVAGRVTGDAVAMGGSVRVVPGARVDGDVTAMGGNIDVAQGAHVRGDRVAMGGNVRGAHAGHHRRPHQPGPAVGPTSRPENNSFFGVGGLVRKALHMVGLYFLLVILGVIMLGVAPQRTRALAAAVAAYPARSLGLGLLVVLATVVAVVILCVTVVGIPIAAVIAAVAGCAAILGLTAVSILIGELVPAKRLRDRQVGKLMVGAGILVTLLALPFAGPVLGFLATMLGLGALAVTRLRPGHAVFATGSGPYRTAPSP